MSFIELQREKAVYVANNCIECGRCYQFCQSEIFPKEHMNSYYMIRQANSAILFNTKISNELKDMIYQCTICDRCYHECPEGLHRSDANLYLKLKLSSPIVQHINLPAIIPKLKNSLSTKIGLSPQSKEERAWIKSLNTLQPAKIMMYHGCYVNFSKETCMKMENILIKAGMDYSSIGGKTYCCGGIEGYRGINKFKKTYSKLKKVIEKINPFEILTSCGHCYEVLKRVIYELDVDIKVKHTSEKILELMNDKKLKFNKIDTTIAIHDPCLLQNLSEEESPARQILSKIVSISEMKKTGTKSECCGNISLAYSPKIVESQKNKIISEFKETNAAHLCTYCPRCIEMFDKSKKELKPISLIDLAYDSIIDKQKVRTDEFVPRPKQNKETEGLLSITKDDKKNELKTEISEKIEESNQEQKNENNPQKPKLKNKEEQLKNKSKPKIKKINKPLNKIKVEKKSVKKVIKKMQRKSKSNNELKTKTQKK